MPPHPWQRQPGEAPADFTAFVAYLRLPGRRSLRMTATQTGRSLGALRRLSTRFNWYAGWWSEWVMQQIQGSILEVICKRCEKAAKG